MRKRRTNDARLALQLAMMLWAHEHQPVSVSEVADHFGLDIDDAYSELYPLQGIEVAVNEEFHNLGVVVDDDGEIFSTSTHYSDALANLTAVKLSVFLQ